MRNATPSGASSALHQSRGSGASSALRTLDGAVSGCSPTYRSTPGRSGFNPTLWRRCEMRPQAEQAPLYTNRGPSGASSALHQSRRSRASSALREGRGYKPLAARATARNRARPLFMVSSHSAAGSESCTMPAPACTCRRPSWITAVRMAMAVSVSPCQPM